MNDKGNYIAWTIVQPIYIECQGVLFFTHNDGLDGVFEIIQKSINKKSVITLRKKFAGIEGL